MLLSTQVAIVRMQKGDKCVNLIADIHVNSPKSLSLARAFVETLERVNQQDRAATVPVYWEFTIDELRDTGYTPIWTLQAVLDAWPSIEKAYETGVLILGQYLDNAQLKTLQIHNIDHRSYTLYKIMCWLMDDAQKARKLAAMDNSLDGTLDGLVTGLTFIDVITQVNRAIARFTDLHLDEVALHELGLLYNFARLCKAVYEPAQSQSLEHCLQLYGDFMINITPVGNVLTTLPPKKMFWAVLWAHYFMPVVNLEMYHAICSDVRNHIIAYAGAEHVKRVIEMLAQNGYKHVEGYVLDRDILATHPDLNAIWGHYPDGNSFELLLQSVNQGNSLS